MVQTRYAPDRGLQARMGLTMFLLGLVFVALVVALVFILAAFKQGAGVIIFFAVILGAGLTFGSLFWSDKIALRASGAREVTPAEAPDLHGTIDRLCALANMPKPRVAIARYGHAQCLRHRPQQQERGPLRDHRAAEAAGPEGTRRRYRA